MSDLKRGRGMSWTSAAAKQYRNTFTATARGMAAQMLTDLYGIARSQTFGCSAETRPRRGPGNPNL